MIADDHRAGVHQRLEHHRTADDEQITARVLEDLSVSADQHQNRTVEQQEDHADDHAEKELARNQQHRYQRRVLSFARAEIL